MSGGGFVWSDGGSGSGGGVMLVVWCWRSDGGSGSRVVAAMVVRTHLMKMSLTSETNVK